MLGRLLGSKNHSFPKFGFDSIGNEKSTSPDRGEFVHAGSVYVARLPPTPFPPRFFC